MAIAAVEAAAVSTATIANDFEDPQSGPAAAPPAKRLKIVPAPTAPASGIKLCRAARSPSLERGSCEEMFTPARIPNRSAGNFDGLRSTGALRARTTAPAPPRRSAAAASSVLIAIVAIVLLIRFWPVIVRWWEDR